MNTTPSKANTSFSTLTPVKFLDSPRQKAQNDQLLTCKNRLDTLTRSLLDNFGTWKAVQKRGQHLCNSIEAIKTKILESKTPGGSLFTNELKAHCDRLANFASSFEDIIKKTKEALRQLGALVKLTENKEEVFYRTWFVEDFVRFTKTILERYQNEYAVKNFVVEEIAHCQNRADLVRVSSLWEYPSHVDEGVELMFLFLAEELKVNK